MVPSFTGKNSHEVLRRRHCLTPSSVCIPEHNQILTLVSLITWQYYAKSLALKKFLNSKQSKERNFSS